jgi:hypothetical protein
MGGGAIESAERIRNLSRRGWREGGGVDGDESVKGDGPRRGARGEGLPDTGGLRLQMNGYAFIGRCACLVSNAVLSRPL